MTKLSLKGHFDNLIIHLLIKRGRGIWPFEASAAGSDDDQNTVPIPSSLPKPTSLRDKKRGILHSYPSSYSIRRGVFSLLKM